MSSKCTKCGAPVNLAPDGDPRYEPPTYLRARLTDTERQLQEAQERCERLESIVRDALSGFRCTQKPAQYPPTHWSRRAESALTPEPDEQVMPDNSEPWSGHKFKRFTGGKWRCECGLELYEVRKMPNGKCNEADCDYPGCDCWERQGNLPLLSRHKQLGVFYGIDGYAALVDAQHRQIEKLQERCRGCRERDDGKPQILRV